MNVFTSYCLDKAIINVSANGTVYCVYSLKDSNKEDVIYVYNDDSSVDDSTTYKFTCMV